MKQHYSNNYPRILQAINLIVLYIFIQTIFDFPLAIYDYLHDTDLSYYKPIRWFVAFGSTLFILLYGYKKTHHPIHDVFPIKRFNPAFLIAIVLFFVGIQFYLDLFNSFINTLLPAPGWFWEMFGKTVDPKGNFWLTVLRVAIIAPIVEEMIFRGIIMHGFMQNYSGVKAVVVSALLFALFHLNPWQFPATFVLGLFLGWLMLTTHSLPLCILGHSINNLLVLVTITFWSQIRSLPFYSYHSFWNFLLAAGMIIAGLALTTWLTSANNKRHKK